MTPFSAVLLGLLLLAAASGLALGRTGRRLRGRVDRHEVATAALAERMAERGRVVVARERLEQTQRVTEGTVDLVTETVRTTHTVIADIPFTVLDRITVTRKPAAVVRKVHDTTAHGVYDAISFVNRVAGRGIRRGIHRDPGRD